MNAVINSTAALPMGSVRQGGGSAASYWKAEECSLSEVQQRMLWYCKRTCAFNGAMIKYRISAHSLHQHVTIEEYYYEVMSACLDHWNHWGGNEPLVNAWRSPPIQLLD